MPEHILKLGKNLTLPLELATQTTSIIGLRGSGKTNSASVIVEELLDNNIPVLIIDPTDAWYGLTSSKSGKQEGYPIAVFGGEHGQLNVTEHDGKVMAEFVVNDRVPVVLSIRHLRKGAQRRLVKELFEELYHLKGKPQNRTPLMVVIDEAPLFIPQVVKGDEMQVVGAVEDLVNRGRNAGFGVLLISQRSATINKNVFDMNEAMIVHRSTGPRDRKAFKDWLEDNISVENMDEVLSSLANLKDGEAWVWSPKLQVFGKYQIRERKTYDSSRTPKIGEIIEPPKKFAEIDRKHLEERLAANLKEAQANDPKTLKTKVAELERKLVEAAAVDSADVSKQVEAASNELYERYKLELKKQKAADLASAQHYLSGAISLLEATPVREFAAKVEEIRKRLENDKEALLVEEGQPLHIASGVYSTRVIMGGDPHATVPTPVFRPVSSRSPSSPSTLTEVQRRILNSLSWWKDIGIATPSRLMVSTVAGYAPGRYFNDSLGQLKTMELVHYVGDQVQLTTAGADSLPELSIASQHTFDDVCNLVRNVLPGAAHISLFDVVAKQAKMVPHNRGTLSDEYLSNATGYAIGRYFNDTKGKLKTLGFFEYPEKGMVRLTAMFEPFLKSTPLGVIRR